MATPLTEAKLNAMFAAQDESLKQRDESLKKLLKELLKEKFKEQRKAFGLEQHQSVNLRQMEQDIHGISERVETMDRRIGFLMHTSPAASLKDKRVHVVGYGNSTHDDAVLGSKKGTWTYILSGTAKLAVSCEHIALRYETRGGYQGLLSYRAGAPTQTDTNDKAFVELPKDLCSHNRVAAIGLLPSHKFGSRDARRTEEDIVIAVLTEFPTEVTVRTLPRWRVRPIQDTTMLRGAQIGGATLTDPVTGTGATSVSFRRSRSFQFHQTCPIDKAKEGALAYWMDCHDAKSDDFILGLYTRGARVLEKNRGLDMAETSMGYICPLRDLKDFGFHDVVDPPKNHSSLTLIDGANTVSISTAPLQDYPRKFISKNSGEELYGVFINTHHNATYTNVESVVHVDFIVSSGHPLDLTVASMPLPMSGGQDDSEEKKEAANGLVQPEIPSQLRHGQLKRDDTNDKQNQRRT